MSKNQLTELPENFGDLVKLKYLDLYQNKLQYLPLSFNKLKALKWLDLKDNPLVPAVAKVAGPCLDAKQCQTSARDVVNFFTQVQEQIASDIENRQKQRQKQLEVNQQKEMENKKSKKKEKVKQKKENGPVKENVQKPQNKKSKKAAASVDKHPQKPSSIFKSFMGVTIFIFLLLFVLTSVKFEHTQIVEEKCSDLYSATVNALPPGAKVYVTTLGGYFKYLHDKTGNVTLASVHYVKNTDNFVNAYHTLGDYIKSVLQKIKEEYKKYVS